MSTDKYRRAKDILRGISEREADKIVDNEEAEALFEGVENALETKALSPSERAELMSARQELQRAHGFRGFAEARSAQANNVRTAISANLARLQQILDSGVDSVSETVHGGGTFYTGGSTQTHSRDVPLGRDQRKSISEGIKEYARWLSQPDSVLERCRATYRGGSFRPYEIQWP